MKKINWTRRNKLLAGVGGLAAVLVAVVLVFTLVGMPGGNKLFGAAARDQRDINGTIYNVRVAELDGQHVLADGDRITFADLGKPATYPGNIRVELALQPNMWWKGVGYRTENVVQYIIEGDWELIGYGSATEFWGSEIARVNNNDFILSKAKEFGIHRAIYRITDIQLQKGHSYRFTWEKE